MTFLPGQTVAAVSVDVIGDNVFNGGDVGANETFSLIVTPTLAIANGTDDSTGIATILNDDVAILGNNANNTLTGDAGPNIILGLGGNDRLEGLAAMIFCSAGTETTFLSALTAMTRCSGALALTPCSAAMASTGFFIATPVRALSPI